MLTNATNLAKAMYRIHHPSVPGETYNVRAPGLGNHVSEPYFILQAHADGYGCLDWFIDIPNVHELEKEITDLKEQLLSAEIQLHNYKVMNR